VAWAAGASIVLGSASEIFHSGVVDDTSVAGVINPIGIKALDAFLAMTSATLVVLPLCILLSAVALVVRFRRSHGVERLQLKWLATAGAFVALVYFIGIVATLLSPSGEPTPHVVAALQDAGLASFIVIPVAIGIAILKHRLYGIDVVINKSVVFGVLAGFITVVYVGIVVGVGSIVGRGDSPSLVLSIAATTIVAVAFQPVRARVQRFANRLVYGARATPYEVLSDFADRMGGTYAAAELLPMMARTVGEGVGAAQVGIWLASGGGLEREASWPIEPPDAPAGEPDMTAVRDLEGLQADRVVPVRHRGELLGALTVVKAPGEAVTPAEDKLLEDVSAQAGLVLRNVRLIEDLRGSRQRLVRAQDEERRRLERNLHDGAQQSLVAVALMIRMIRARLDADSLPVGETLDEAGDQLSAAIDELRVLARGIHPVILSERGLAPAINALAERSPVPVVVEYRLEERPPAELEATAYYVVAEALANVVKHAHATEAVVEVTRSDDELVLEVSDDGVGGCDRTRGTGILRLADRVSVVEGTLVITSPPGQGTRLVCRLPLPLSVRRTEVAPVQQRPTQPLGAGL
jgi:signal transduction histidine kinase